MMELERPNPDDYQQGDCDGYEGGCHVCASGYVEDLRQYRAEYVKRRDAAGPVGYDKDAAFEAEFEIQWADREIKIAVPQARRIARVYEMPKSDPVVTREVHEDGSVTVTERWSALW